ncbi:PhoX family phosphatase [Dactylosporangium aurantiacum]|uniref:PhoX family phosphatase n=1 Tax=Dactylosporangium aurantiacum TaxID=35754 RepID=A0A9Q9MJQ0_9ACTN|nr:PhoX family phosphatase [Dactylosporangium aurantiacum]MDG6101050.1 PhoX family phosphatase [Dactylosporangium aurantiacum]UWZ54911.1 PhoX family phosphatase [Dactylosporangium aurantiacum]
MSDNPRRPLPFIGAANVTHGGRDRMTCLYRCGNACEHPVPNQSDNPYFTDEMNAVSRRGVMRAGAIVLGLAGTGIAAGTPAFASPAGEAGEPDVVVPEVDTYAAKSAEPSQLTFKAVTPNQVDGIVVPNGYDHAVVIRWGDEVVPGAPRFNIAKQSAEAQSKQFGYNNDFVAVLPLDRRGERALLVCNHEYTNEDLMFPNFPGIDGLSVEQLRTAMAAHGMSVVELERVGDTGRWTPVTRGWRRYNRRITALSTHFKVTGPAAGSDLLKTAADPSGRDVIGTLNNCAGGVTPWGTILSGEENFNQYFVGAETAVEPAKTRFNRYGIDTVNRYPSGSRKWDRADARFDLTKNPNEAHRFGWVVEVDPFTPGSTPRKHTALGRVKHEGANVIIAKNGKAVAYMGDDERFDYLYKFVSDKKFDSGKSYFARRHNLTLLESGSLYVAKLGFTSAAEIDGSGKLPADGAFNGTGEWVALVKDGKSQVPGMSVEEVLVFTRLAGDAVGATKMDRPEDVEPNPKTGKIYVALTNNTARGPAGKAPADEANPRTNNKHGHIFEITENNGDHTGTAFTWTIPIVCGDPKDPATYFMGFDKTQVSPISCPDNVAFDGAGNLWIATDGNALGTNDGLFAVPLDGPEKGHLKQFLTVPYGAETCGPWIHGDNRSAFVAVQHPGEISGASVEKPASNWPDGDFAKPGIAVAWRLDGRNIGV